MARILLRPVRPPATRRHCATIGRVGPAEIRSSTLRVVLAASVATLMMVVVAPRVWATQAEDDPQPIRDERPVIRDSEADALEAIAMRLDRDGQADRASSVRALIVPPPPADGPRRFDPLPEIVAAPEADEVGADPIAAEVSAAREESARRFDDLADRALGADRLALADACLREVLRRRPDDPEARRLLGYVPHEGGWATPHAVLRLKNGDVFHSTFGWIPSDWVPQLDRGLLPAPARAGRGDTQWLPADEADAMRQAGIASGWQITTPHFKIQASVTLAEGIDFARRLEAFYDLFTSVVADVIGPQRLPLAQLHRAPGAAAPAVAPRQHRVYYFGTKRQYVDYLVPRMHDPKIKDTLGVYLDDQKISYFFKDDGGELPVEATLYHEVSHQLLFELAGPSGYQRNAGNYWVFEGLGTYFETVEPQSDGSLRYGGRIGPRIDKARQWIVDHDRLIPTARFVALDRGGFNDELRGDPHLHYAEAIALAVFLMDADRASRRDGFLDYAADAYHGRLRSGSSRTLSSHLGMGYEEIDRALQAFLAEEDGAEIAGR